MSSNEEATNLQPGDSGISGPPRTMLKSVCPLPVHIGLINDMIEGPIPNEEDQAVYYETHIIPDALSGVSNLAGKANRAPKGKTLISLVKCID